jgi:hypothetical protein
MSEAHCAIRRFGGAIKGLRPTVGSIARWLLDRPVKPGDDSYRGRDQNTTSGLTGEPVPPSTGSGAKVIMNS